MGWEDQLAERVLKPAPSQETPVEPDGSGAGGARARGLAVRARDRAIARRRATPPLPEWAQRAAGAAGYDMDEPDGAA